MFLPIAPVIVEPEDGLGPVLDFLRTAKTRLLIKQFTFNESTLLEEVAECAARGIDVRVMLNPKRSGGDRANDASFEMLASRGVNVKWSSPKFCVTHEKSIVVDDKAALIATFNLAAKYFLQTRDYGVVVTDHAQVSQIAAGFEADWREEDWTPSEETGLLWSNHNARTLMSRFIDSAEETLAVQHPKFVDATILDRLLSAVHRGVKVRVLCGGRHGISDWDILDTFSSLRVLRRSGAKVHKQKNLRLHAKLLIADKHRALVGSMNIDRSAFDLRRELGIETGEPAVVRRLLDVFESDWDASHGYEPPDPLQSLPHEEHDEDLRHE